MGGPEEAGSQDDSCLDDDDTSQASSTFYSPATLTPASKRRRQGETTFSNEASISGQADVAAVHGSNSAEFSSAHTVRTVSGTGTSSGSSVSLGPPADIVVNGGEGEGFFEDGDEGFLPRDRCADDGNFLVADAGYVPVRCHGDVTKFLVRDGPSTIEDFFMLPQIYMDTLIEVQCPILTTAISRI